MNVFSGFQELFLTLSTVSIAAASDLAKQHREVCVLLGTILNKTMIKHFCRKEECISAYSYCEDWNM